MCDPSFFRFFFGQGRQPQPDLPNTAPVPSARPGILPAAAPVPMARPYSSPVVPTVPTVRPDTLPATAPVPMARPGQLAMLPDTAQVPTPRPGMLSSPAAPMAAVTSAPLPPVAVQAQGPDVVGPQDAGKAAAVTLPPTHGATGSWADPVQAQAEAVLRKEMDEQLQDAPLRELMWGNTTVGAAWKPTWLRFGIGDIAPAFALAGVAPGMAATANRVLGIDKLNNFLDGLTTRDVDGPTGDAIVQRAFPIYSQTLDAEGAVKEALQQSDLFEAPNAWYWRPWAQRVISRDRIESGKFMEEPGARHLLAGPGPDDPKFWNPEHKLPITQMRYSRDTGNWTYHPYPPTIPEGFTVDQVGPKTSPGASGKW